MTEIQENLKDLLALINFCIDNNESTLIDQLISERIIFELPFPKCNSFIVSNKLEEWFILEEEILTPIANKDDDCISEILSVCTENEIDSLFTYLIKTKSLSHELKTEKLIYLIEYCIERNNIDAIEYLVMSGSIDKNTVSLYEKYPEDESLVGSTHVDKKTILEKLVYYSIDTKNYQLFLLLIQEEIINTTTDRIAGMLPMHFSISIYNKIILTILLDEYQGSINIQDEVLENKTPLIIAFEKYHYYKKEDPAANSNNIVTELLEIIELIFKFNPDLSIEDNAKNNAIEYAINRYHSLELTKIILQSNITPDQIKNRPKESEELTQEENFEIREINKLIDDYEKKFKTPQNLLKRLSEKTKALPQLE